ncbi:MAG TPA: Txe/YoeB family addiction module toxin [Chthoniobacterales bacterium]|jgi:toxin YoeB
MRQVAFHAKAFSDYSEWAGQDRKLFDRLTKLIVEAAHTPFTGTGKPEALKHGLKGCWSRRINDEHRLVYQVTDERLMVISCRYHY